MLWKPGHPNLPNNRSVAFKRMMSKERQLVKKGKLEAFNKEVKALVDREVVIKMKQEEVEPEEPACYLSWYLLIQVQISFRCSSQNGRTLPLLCSRKRTMSYEFLI